MPVNYQDTKIYKLVLDNELDHPIYIGHSAQKYLSDRMKGHKTSFKRWKKGKYSKLSYFTEDLDMTKIKIVLIEQYPCNNVAEARGRELYWINEYKTKQNKPQPILVTGGMKEWTKEYKKKYAIENKDIIAEKHKQYHLEHAEHIKQKTRKYYNDNKEHVKEREKQYALSNKEKIKERNKQYRAEHTEEIKTKKSAKKPCELCGKEISSCHLARHKRENCPNRNKTDSISIDDSISLIPQENLYQTESDFVVD